MLVEDKVDMYLDMDDSDYVDETNFDRKEPMVKRRLRSKKNRPRKDKRKQTSMMEKPKPLTYAAS